MLQDSIAPLQERALSISEKFAEYQEYELGMVNRRIRAYRKIIRWKRPIQLLQVVSLLNIIFQITIAWSGQSTAYGMIGAIGSVFSMVAIHVNGLTAAPSRAHMARGLAGDLIEMQSFIITSHVFGKLKNDITVVMDDQTDIKTICRVARDINTYRSANEGPEVIRSGVLPRVAPYCSEYTFTPTDVSRIKDAMEANPLQIGIYETIVSLMIASTEKE